MGIARSIVDRPAISVVTATFNAPPEYLLDAFASLCRQPERWEWIIQVDGDRCPLPDEIVADKRVSVAYNNRHLGIAITRNRALVRSRGEYVRSLDSDDQLAEGAFDRAAHQLGFHSNAAFCFGRSERLLTDGSRAPDAAPAFTAGIIEPGVLERRWRDDGRSPLRYGTILWRRSHLLSLGGWAALSEMEDVAVTLDANLEHPCIFIEDVVLVSRDHKNQTTISASCIADREINRALVHARLYSRREVLGLQAAAHSETPPADNSLPQAVAKARRFGILP